MKYIPVLLICASIVIGAFDISSGLQSAAAAISDAISTPGTAWSRAAVNDLQQREIKKDGPHGRKHKN